MNNHCYINEDYLCSIAPVLRGFYRLRNLQQTRSDSQTPLKNPSEHLNSKRYTHRRNKSDMPVPHIQTHSSKPFKPNLEIVVTSRCSSREPMIPHKLHKKAKPDSSHAFFPYRASPKLIVKKESKLKKRKKSSQDFKRSLNRPAAFEFPDPEIYKIRLKELQGKRVKKGPKIYPNQIFFDVFDEAGNHDRVLDTFDEAASSSRAEYNYESTPSTRMVYCNLPRAHTDQNSTIKLRNCGLKVPGNSLMNSRNTSVKSEVEAVPSERGGANLQNLNFKLEELLRTKHDMKRRYALCSDDVEG